MLGIRAGNHQQSQDTYCDNVMIARQYHKWIVIATAATAANVQSV